MSDDQQEFASLMTSLHEGSQDAAQKLYKLYGHHVRRVVRRNLHKRLRSKFDSDDFTQAVWASFFAEEPRHREFKNPAGFVAFLASLAHNKVLEAVRARHTKKRDVTREQSLDDSTIYLGKDLIAPQDTPSQIAMGNEAWDRLMAGQPVHCQRILLRLRQGHTNEEIARELAVNEKTVRRLVRRLMRGTES